MNTLEFAPNRAFKYFAVSFAVIISVCFMLEHWILPCLEDAGELTTPVWQIENVKLYRFMQQRNLADRSCPIWRSLGIPLTIKKSRCKRILVIGDSFVWGYGTANINNIWWRQLQRELERRGYTDVEVIAAGLSGFSTHDELICAKKLVPLYSPDLVIFGYVVNDPDEKIPGSKKPWVRKLWSLPDDSLSNWIDKNFGTVFPNLAYQLVCVRQMQMRKLLNGVGGKYEFSRWELEILKGKNFEQYRHTVKELSQFVHNCRIPVFVMTLPTYPNYGRYASRYIPIEKLYEENGVCFVNCLSQWCRQANTEVKGRVPASHWLINPVNMHPGTVTCHFFADYAATFIERRYPQVLGVRHRAILLASEPKINDWVPPALMVRQLNAETFQLQFPNSADQMLRMPIRRPYVQLNLERPVAVSQLELSGQGLQSAEVYVTSENIDRGYDDGSLHKLCKKHGPAIAWTMPNNRTAFNVNTIRISAKVVGPDRSLKLKFTTPSYVLPPFRFEQ